MADKAFSEKMRFRVAAGVERDVPVEAKERLAGAIFSISSTTSSISRASKARQGPSPSKPCACEMSSTKRCAWCKFSPVGGTVSIDAAQDAQGGFSIVVSDQGSGMDEKLIAGIGTPFLRGADSFVANSEGIGLGLAITVQLVVLLGGRLDLSNRLPHGLTARAAFPCLAGANMNAPIELLSNRANSIAN